MTGTVGIFLALVAGLLVADRRRLVVALAVPFLGVAALQTWGIWTGRGVSPPSTVDAWPGLIGYYVVQAIIFALALGIALQLSAFRFRDGGAGRPTAALVVNCVVAALVVSGFELDRPFFDPGSVVRHSSQGKPPVLGIAGIALLSLVCAVLGGVTLWRWARATRGARTV